MPTHRQRRREAILIKVRPLDSLSMRDILSGSGGCCTPPLTPCSLLDRAGGQTSGSRPNTGNLLRLLFFTCLGGPLTYTNSLLELPDKILL